MGRIFHQLTKLGKNVFPYTDIEAVSDADGRTLKEILRNLRNKFDELELSVKEGAIEGPQGPEGEPAKNIELRKTNTHIQWKLEHSEDWIDLINLEDLIPNGVLEDEEGNLISIKDIANKEWVAELLNNSIEDSLEIGSVDKSLSAHQGKILKENIDYILKYIGNFSFDEDGNITGVQGPKGEDGKNIELIVKDNILKWKLIDSNIWTDLIDFSKLLPNLELPSDLSNILTTDKISNDLEFDPDDFLLTVSQGKTLKSSIDTIYDFLANTGLDTNVDMDGLKGEDGRNPEFRENNSILQWRLEGSEEWIDLFTINNSTSTSIEVEDTLESESSESALSANQGRILNEKIVSIINLVGGVGVPPDSENCTPGVDGKSVELRNNEGVLQWRLEGESKWIDLIDLSNTSHPDCIDVEDTLESESVNTALSANQGRELNDKIANILSYLNNIGLDPTGSIAGVQGPKGEDAKNIELKKNYTHIQWRYIGDLEWNDLVPLSDLRMDCEMELDSYATKEWSKDQVIDNLESDDYNKPLSARQGKALNELVGNIYEYIKKLPENSEELNQVITIIDDLITGGSKYALSAEQGVVLSKRIKELEDEISSIKNTFSERLNRSLLQPGYILNGEMFIDINEWTCSYCEPVIPGKVYTFRGDINCNKLRWSYFSISNGKLEFLSNEVTSDKKYVTIKIPSNAHFIRLGFNTINPFETILNYSFTQS